VSGSRLPGSAIIAAVAARIVLIAAALVVGGWLAFTLRALHLEEDARALIPPPPARTPPADVARIERLLDRASTLNPDVRPDVARAFLLAVSGDSARSIAVIEDVYRREPDNLRAARILEEQLRRTDPRAADEVAAQIRRIAPPVD